jgi:hypothetical protein
MSSLPWPAEVDPPGPACCCLDRVSSNPDVDRSLHHTSRVYSRIMSRRQVVSPDSGLRPAPGAHHHNRLPRPWLSLLEPGKSAMVIIQEAILISPPRDGNRSHPHRGENIAYRENHDRFN